MNRVSKTAIAGLAAAIAATAAAPAQANPGRIADRVDDIAHEVAFLGDARPSYEQLDRIDQLQRRLDRLERRNTQFGGRQARRNDRQIDRLQDRLARIEYRSERRLTRRGGHSGGHRGGLALQIAPGFVIQLDK